LKENIIRLNLGVNWAAKKEGRKLPVWFIKLFDDLVLKIANEYMVSIQNASEWITNNGDNTGIPATERFVEQLEIYFNIKCKAYNVEGLRSWGILIDEFNPTVVEYKLKCNNNDISS
jgi:hypothetical protein